MGLFKFHKVVNIDMIQILLKELIRKLILDFKILIWEPRNEIQISKEKGIILLVKTKRRSQVELNII